MANIVTAFKSLGQNDYTVTPFPAYSSKTYTYVSGSTSNPTDIEVLYGKKYVTGSGLRVANAENELFDSAVQSFYSPIPYAAYGLNTSSYHPTSSVFVISVTQDVFGEEIKPGTFSVRVGTSMSYDDGRGNLIASSSGIGNVVGSIFYDKGIALLKPTASIAGGGLTNNGICIVDGTSVQIQFTSSVLLFEHMIKVKIEPNEFNYSLYNPSTNKVVYTGSNKRPTDLMVSGALLPYVSTIGLYNPANELLAVAKVSNPIQRTTDLTQTFIIRFDT